MIFIWTSDGGPLQYVSLFLFLLYQLHPFFFSPPLLLEVENESSSAASSINDSADAVTSNDDDDDDASLIFMMIFTCTVVALGILGVALYSNRNNVIEWFRRTRQQQQQQQQQQEENSTTQQRMVPLYATLGSIAGIICGGSLWWWWNSDNPNISAIASDIYLTVLSLVQLIGFVYMFGSSFMRRQENGNNNSNNSSSNNSNKMIKIMSKIREMPIEEFYKNDKESYSCLSISQLKEMLRVRGMIQQQEQQNGTKFLERSDLVSALISCRKYSESCCICCEDYNDNNNNNNHYNNNTNDTNNNNTQKQQLGEEGKGGSDLGTRDILRIFPQCHHEFHLECLDQWAYTFQNKPDHLLPTCPLCKTPIK